VLQEQAGLRLGDGSDPAANLVQHLAGEPGTALTPFLELGRELGGCAHAALHDLGDDGSHDVAVAHAADGVDHGSFQRGERPPSGLRGREPVGALDHHQAVPAAPSLARYEQVHGPARPGCPLQPVQFKGVEAGDQRVRAGVEQAASTPIVPSRRSIAQQHEAGRHASPRPSGAAAVRDRVAVHTELDEVADENDGTAPVRDEIVEVGDIGAATSHAPTVRPSRGSSQANLGSVDARGARWKTPIPTNGALVG
jgi:hypothetical protein